jgi:hypothetical protein
MAFTNSTYMASQDNDLIRGLLGQDLDYRFSHAAGTTGHSDD